MKILIVGSNLNAALLAKYIKLQNPESDIYTTFDDGYDQESFTNINIRENDVASLCDFVKYNQIEFTIVLSQLSIINGIADVFTKEGFPCFAPSSEAARPTFFNSISKKIMYKLKINTPKFGIFDRSNIAVDYVRNSKFPIIIKNDFTLIERNNIKCDTFLKAKTELLKIFESNNEKIVIENYIDSEPFYIYFVTDGFNAMPLITLQRYKDGNIPAITAPCSKISENITVNIVQKVIYPLLDDISKYTNNYKGILGLKIKLEKNNFYVLEFYNEFQEYDLQTFLSLSAENILNLLYTAANGNLGDVYDCVNLIDRFSYTVVIDKKEIIKNDDDNEFIETIDNNKSIITNTASTLNYARESLLDYLNAVCEKI